MLKPILLMAACLAAPSLVAATEYIEPVDTSAVDIAGWKKGGKALTLSWVSKDHHYRQFATPPQAKCSDTTVTAWRGERLGLEALAVSRKDAGPIRVELSDFRDAKGRAVAMPGSGAMLMRYVWTNDMRACGHVAPDTIPAYTVADVIDLPGTVAELPARSVRPIWCTVEMPRDIEPGRYFATLSLRKADGGKELAKIKLGIDVISRTLPAPEDYAFYLDLWQQPYAVSRYYGVPAWSAEHFERLKPYAELMKRAGQKAVTTILFYEPWGEQSNDKFEPMVETVREPDATWTFGYDVFDRYVEFMATQGIDRAIECFTMVPWQMKFRYLDRATGRYEFLEAPTSSPEYRELWTAAIKALADHVRAKGWFDKTYIYMDERSPEQMRDAIAVAKAAVPDIKMGLAGDYHKELVDVIDSYAFGRNSYLTAEEQAARSAKGMTSLRYTCCSQPEPSQFSNNDPADGAYLPVYATASGYDGYLHWSFQNWNDTPLTDTRWRMFGPGDTYFIYPDGRSSVRYERFAEGVQLSEKIRLLRDAMSAAGDTAGLTALAAALAPIICNGMSASEPSDVIVNDLERAIDLLSRK